MSKVSEVIDNILHPHKNEDKPQTEAEKAADVEAAKSKQTKKQNVHVSTNDMAKHPKFAKFSK